VVAKNFLLSEVEDRIGEFVSEYGLNEDGVTIIEGTMKISVERLPDTRLR